MKKIFLTSLCVLFISQAKTAELKLAKRVIDGFESNAQTFPYHTVLKRDDGKICGGGLFDKNWVITSATCVHDVEKIDLIFGVEDLTYYNDRDTKTMQPEKIYSNPNYNSKSYENDIAIIKLPEPLETTLYIKPMNLQSSSEADYNFKNEALKLAGFGSRNAKNKKPNDIINFGISKGIDNKDCKIRSHQIFDTMLCGKPTPANKYIMCTGDEGCPITSLINKNQVIVGIAIFSANNCKAPNVFTRIAPYLDWISETTGIEF